jgi:hypothetical protein
MLLLLTGCQRQSAEEDPPTSLTEPKSGQGIEVAEPVVGAGQPGPKPGPEEPVVSKPETDKHGPRITFEKVVSDLGEIVPGSNNSTDFVFKNTGDARLIIKSVKACCGFRYKIKDDKMRYAPGEGGVITIMFNASRYAYQLKKYQHVYSNDKTSPDVMLTVTANIVMKVKHSPRELKLVLKDENAGCPALTLTSIDDQPFSIRSFKARGNCLTAEFDSSKKDTKFVLQPKADLQNLEKNRTGYIRVGLTHPLCEVITVPFTVVPRFELNPRAIIIRKAEPRKPVERYVWVLNNYGEDFEVESARATTSMIEVVDQEKHGNRYKYRLSINPPDNKGKKVVSGTFLIKIKDGKELRVSCHVWYAK